MTLKLNSRWLVSTAVVPALLAAAPVAAQESAQPAETQTENSGLQDIIVTARRVSENLQDVPVAVTAFSGDTLEQQNAQSIIDVANFSPGFTMTRGNSSETALLIQSRGQVQMDIVATLDPSVGTYVDGHYWARAYGLNADLLDIESVQILRGPQGTLFGRNTTGGALLVQTRDPELGSVSGELSATYGRFDERAIRGIVNLPLGEHLAVRGAFSRSKRDGYARNSISGSRLGERNETAARLKLLYQPTDNFSILLSGEYFRTKATTRPYVSAYVAPTSPINLEAAFEVFGPGATATRFPQGVALVNAAIAANGPDDAALNEDPFTYAKTKTLTGTAALETSFGTVKFIGGYRKTESSVAYDLDGLPYFAIRSALAADIEQYSGEFQISGATDDDKIEYTAGLFAFTEGGTDQSTAKALPVLSALSGPLTRQVILGNVRNRSMGVYGQATFHLSDKFSLVGGVRYSVEDKNLTIFNRTVVDATDAIVFCSVGGALPAEDCRVRRKDSFDGISYTAGINFTPSDDLLIYAKRSRGFRSGGQNIRAAGGVGSAFVPFDPEVSTEHEIGLKSQFLDNRIRLNIAAFHNEVEDIQRSTIVASTLPNGATATATIVSNAGKARFMGGEAELTARVADLTFNASAGFVDPKYIVYVDPTSGLDRSTEPFQAVPRWTANVGATYEHEFGFGGLRLNASYSWQGRTSYNNVPLATTGSAAQDTINAAIRDATTRKAGGFVNLRAALTLMDDKLEIAAFGRNVLDRRVIDTGLVFGPPLNAAAVRYSEPATYGVTATFKFGG